MKPKAVYQMPWMLGDAPIVGAVVVGRANIDYPNGGRTHGLMVQLASGNVVVYFDRATLRFSIEELSA